MTVSSFREIRRAPDAETFDKLLSNPEFLKLLHLYGECSEDSNGPMEKIAPTLTNFFLCYQGRQLETLPRFCQMVFAYDHTSYAQYLPVYFLVTMGSFKIITLRHISYWQIEIWRSEFDIPWFLSATS